MKSRYNILFIDDEKKKMQYLIKELERSNKFKVDLCTQILNLESMLKAFTYDLAILDIMMEPILTEELYYSKIEYNCHNAGLELGIPILNRYNLPFIIFTNTSKDRLSDKHFILISNMEYLIKKDFDGPSFKEYLLNILTK